MICYHSSDVALMFDSCIKHNISHAQPVLTWSSREQHSIDYYWTSTNNIVVITIAPALTI